MIELPERSKFSLQMAKEGLFCPVSEEPISFNFNLYSLASGAPTLTPEFYKKFACIFGEKVNKHPLEILQELKHEYFLSAIYDSGDFLYKEDFIDRYDYLESMDKKIEMIDEARYVDNTGNSNAKKYTDLMKRAIRDDSGKYVMEFDKQRLIISQMNKIIERILSGCLHGKIKLPDETVVSLGKFTDLYQTTCRASEVYRHKQKLDAGLVFIKDRVFPVPPERDHYS